MNRRNFFRAFGGMVWVFVISCSGVEQMPLDQLCRKIESFQTEEEFNDWLGPQYIDAVPISNVIACLWKPNDPH